MKKNELYAELARVEQRYGPTFRTINGEQRYVPGFPRLKAHLERADRCLVEGRWEDAHHALGDVASAIDSYARREPLLVAEELLAATLTRVKVVREVVRLCSGRP